MKVLLTGANGYIGRRLKHALMGDSSIDLRLMVRQPASLDEKIRPQVEVVAGNVLKPETLPDALKDIDVAYYLIHSMASGADYRELDRQSATNFLEAAVAAGVKRIIYLGGLGEKESASEHLLSRIETGEILSSRPDKVQCLWFRAGVIIGSGSASFEIIRNLTQKLPVMITPQWVKTKAQPIGVNDVVRYLYQASGLDVGGNQVIDIGSEQMSYGDMMVSTASVMGLKRRLVPVPLLTPKLSSYWLALFTPVPYSIASSLILGLKSEVVVRNTKAKELFDFEPEDFQAIVKRALQEIEENQVVSRWSDSGGDVWESNHQHDIANALYLDRQKIDIRPLSAESVYRSFLCIGGQQGWFGYDWLWGLRGMIDKLLGGAGTNRGRRDSCSLRLGDSLDFWRVVDVQENRRLLLFAQMKVPGKAWLEFMIEDGYLIQSAYFYPMGLLGRLYWFALKPLHFLIFRDMIRQIVDRAASGDGKK